MSWHYCVTYVLKPYPPPKGIPTGLSKFIRLLTDRRASDFIELWALSLVIGQLSFVIRHWTLGIRQKNARHFLFLLLFLPSSFSKEKPLSHLTLNRGEFIQPLLLPIFIMRSAPGRQSRDSFSFSVEVFLTIHHQHKSVSSVQSVFYHLLFPLASCSKIYPNYPR